MLKIVSLIFQIYVSSQCGATPVLSLLGERAGSAGRLDVSVPDKPFVTEANVIMYLDMIHEKVIELKCVNQVNLLGT